MTASARKIHLFKGQALLLVMWREGELMIVIDKCGQMYSVIASHDVRSVEEMR